ncbi:beta-ketoacyl synthase N-terminal-like domain-containing protein [Streptomyces sp. ME19-01-6]|uniref:beta-ketoacyl synthase N-terminal-like domain-containing protein n=1 Tax=Streptomyces sp. ME19-01-6 TaxID=3028686 RepID=UPI0029A9C83E|nr:beta-ketoacyl synthase N-terminal-like domain-containing protein [Streptomyces sp. ME19-01-6]MDX3233764.1 beta-ketoacyl synthase N-terminal-like domain-containing protein [Streptomyces sp. ME19-01-6]
MTTDLIVSGVGTVRPEGFDFKTALGRRGYKYLPTASQYFLAAAKRALADIGQDDPLEATCAERRAAAVGTNSAAASLHDAMDRTVMETGAADLSPVTAPYFSINLFGSRLAMEHGLKGFNLTFVSPRIAGLEAIETGQRALAAGRARWLLAGATEQVLAEGEPGADTSEAGAVALVLEPAAAVAARGGRAYGRVAVRSFFLPPAVAAAAHGAERARALIDGALEALGRFPGRPLPVTAVIDDSPVGEAFAAALGERAEYVPAGAGCLEPVARVVAALAGGAGPARLVLTAAAEGNAAVCLVTPAGSGTQAGTEAESRTETQDEARAEARAEEGGG